MTAPTVRLTCACWQGDPYEGRHTGICGGDGWIDVPAVEVLTGGWRDFVVRSDGWSVTSHRCAEPLEHDVNAGSRFHDGVHEMLFCCGPCMLGYLVGMYRQDEPLQEKILVAALSGTVIR